MYTNLTEAEIELKNEILGKLQRHFGRCLEEATKEQLYRAIALTLRDEIMRKWTKYKHAQRRAKEKELYYLSFEFLMGRSLTSNLLNLGMTDKYMHVLEHLGLSLSEIAETEPDAGLGSGGLGRLAACFMDSLATLSLPAFGSSIRYEYGLFRQKIVDGFQTELPDAWLGYEGSVWEVPHPEEQVKVIFGGTVRQEFTPVGLKIHYDNATEVLAIPYDVPVCGYGSEVVNTLRLWSARSVRDINMQYFSGGDYLKAVEEKALAEVLSKVLYPEDNHYEGKALRLKQQYFFVSATMQWIVRRYKKYHSDITRLADKVVIHVNDTHPALAIPELMRILMDEEGLGWDEAWGIVYNTFAYTNHTIMSEALEKWPVEMFRTILPRIWQIIDEMNRRLVSYLRGVYGDDWGKINYMSIVAYNYVNMANLCLASCFAVNGVSKLHTGILTGEVFGDYYKLNPDKFYAITNGITYRRWLKNSNPALSELISKKIGDRWVIDSSRLKLLEKYAKDPSFQSEFAKVKRQNKLELAQYIKKQGGGEVDPDSIFDVQVKRLHEYKRQLLNVLRIMYLYHKLKTAPGFDIYPRTFIFGAKASPGYVRAKLIIKLINSVADMIECDPYVRSKIKVVFVENYGVSLAEKIIKAADVSEQISTAGLEASGTGNMKFMLNGALTVGTLDGANIEMLECVGPGNIYIFGLKAPEVHQTIRLNPTISHEIYSTNPDVKRVVDMLIDGSVLPENPRMFLDLYNSLLVPEGGVADRYMVLADFQSFIRIHEEVEKEYQIPDMWWEKAIVNVANAGFFSSDRTIREYNEKIWHLKPFKF